MGGIRLSNAGQKRLILDCLHESPMTVEALAKRMLCSPDTVRKRLKELQEETRMVRVVGWDMKGNALVRLWGIGAKRRGKPLAPPASGGRRAAAEKTESTGGKGNAATGNKAVPYRLEAMDQWLFAIRRAS